jgi:hypothetical protein
MTSIAGTRARSDVELVSAGGVEPRIEVAYRLRGNVVGSSAAFQVPTAEGHLPAFINSVVSALQKGEAGFRMAAANDPEHFSHFVYFPRHERGKNASGQFLSDFGELHFTVRDEYGHEHDARIIASIRNFMRDEFVSRSFFGALSADEVGIVLHRRW